MRTIASGMASTPRNPTIAKVLYLRKAIEMWGRGIGLILAACEKAHLAAPKIYEDRGFVYTVFARPTAQEWQGKVGETDEVNREVNPDVNAVDHVAEQDVNRRILELLRNDPKCRIQDLAAGCGVSRAKIDRLLKRLKAQKLIRRVGGTRGVWEVC
jgi:predicted HTH transcriptional regulator